MQLMEQYTVNSYIFNHAAYSFIYSKRSFLFYSGHYMLFNSSASNDPNAVGQLMSPQDQTPTGEGCLEFFYSAFGICFRGCSILE
jgi:hypothetical protein